MPNGGATRFARTLVSVVDAMGAALMSLSTVIVAINAKLLERARRLVASTAQASV